MTSGLIQEIDGDDGFKPIHLTPAESSLRALLLDAAEHIDQNSKTPNSDRIVLRFTGGWVRDKLLGVQSNDIDVAINIMTGYQFALQLKDYLEIPGNLAKYGLSDQDPKTPSSLGGIHKIDANPEKSKHLETVTTKLLGFDLDLVNLRKETYSEDSRNPQMEVGTPLEDALRRDATVNAMFYNLHSQEVEDFTGKGRQDMHKKIIRTPLEPFQTFKDDPLRVLRLIRFASRLGYTIDDEALEAMSDQSIKDALKRKISRERIGVELEKALRGPDPHEALRLIFSCGLYDTVFCDPEVDAVDDYKPDIGDWQSVIGTLRDEIDAESLSMQTLVRNGQERYMAWLLAAIVPYRDAPPPPKDKKQKAIPLAVRVARSGFKAPNKVSSVIETSLANQGEIASVVEKFNQQKRGPDGKNAGARDILGMFIRKLGPSWRSQVLYSFLVEVADNPGSIEATERRYSALLERLKSLSILDAYAMKLIVDGTSLTKALNTMPGPWLKDALDVAAAYQLRHAEETDPAKVIEAVKDHRGELSHDLAVHFLELTIRPLFKARPTNITEQGRKVMGETLPLNPSPMVLQDVAWKEKKNAYALELLQWTVHSLTPSVLRQYWHLVIPPLLTLLDDWEIRYKCIGANSSKRLFELASADLLHRTGLDEILSSTLLASMHYMPPSTSPEESIELISHTIPALIVLANKQNNKLAFLDTLMRKILSAHGFAESDPHLAAELLQWLIPIMQDMGIETVKHMKFIIPILVTELGRSKSSHQTNILARIMIVVIQTCAPRVYRYRAEIMKSACLAWLSDETRGSSEELRGVVRALSKVAREHGHGTEDFVNECQILVDAEPGLEGMICAKNTQSG
ncbi:poly A polymerase C-terminal region-like protein [Piedraia hortae CBS 480.64]|uniref:Poly A polymerase C-terminal region-like protein n=1 Tax=Piedraia hortae CBS 480.64 TaxID=1314780 RepID=A0A6A7C300_9PEZI|nr:poly A polymerase C-terminal region-like protein [Piedraia hortae CBS 480.64]